MARTHPIRTLLLTITPVLFAALQVSLWTTGHSLLGVGFAAALVGYSVGTTRIHLARHRIEMLHEGLPVGT